MGMTVKQGSANDEPMMDINTVPLIDVLLVLIIMFIITIPIQSHAVKLDLPQPNPDQPQVIIEPVKNKVVVTTQGVNLWNGTPVDIQQLRVLLERTQQMNPIPELHLQPEPNARYEDVNEVLVATRQAQVTKLGFVGNEQFSGVF
jgi:biopolymer transport protein ExbD